MPLKKVEKLFLFLERFSLRMILQNYLSLLSKNIKKYCMHNWLILWLMIFIRKNLIQICMVPQLYVKMEMFFVEALGEMFHIIQFCQFQRLLGILEIVGIIQKDLR